MEALVNLLIAINNKLTIIFHSKVLLLINKQLVAILMPKYQALQICVIPCTILHTNDTVLITILRLLSYFPFEYHNPLKITRIHY